MTGYGLELSTTQLTKETVAGTLPEEPQSRNSALAVLSVQNLADRMGTAIC